MNYTESNAQYHNWPLVECAKHLKRYELHLWRNTWIHPSVCQNKRDALAMEV